MIKACGIFCGKVAVILFRIFTYALYFLFFTLFALFIFLVFVQSNPKSAQKFVSSSIKRTLEFTNIQYSDITTNVKNGNVEVKISKASKEKQSVSINADNIHLYFSFYDILHGRLYKMQIEQLSIEVKPQSTKNEDSENEEHGSISRYYRLLPQLKIMVKSLVIKFDKKTLILQNSLMILNQSGYIMWLKTECKEDAYSINIALNSKTMRVIFNNVPFSVVKKYAQDIPEFILLKTASGFVEFDARNLQNIQYSFDIEGLQILQNKYIKGKIESDSVHIFGERTVNTATFNIKNAILTTGESLTIHLEKNGDAKKISASVKNAQIKRMKALVPIGVIKGTKHEKLTTYLTQALYGEGFIKNAEVSLSFPIKEINDVSVKVEFEDTDFMYSEYFSPAIKNTGSVDVNTHRTIVNVKRGYSQGNEISNTVVKVLDGRVFVNFNIHGSPLSLANVFFPERDLQEYTTFVNGKSSIKGEIDINLTCNDIFRCTKFKAQAKLSELSTFLNRRIPASGVLNVKKGNGGKISTSVDFGNFTSKYFVASKVNVDVETKQDAVVFSGNVFDENSNKILTAKNITFNTANGFRLQNITLQSVDFAENNFTLEYIAGNHWNIIGKKANIPFIADLLERIKTDDDANSIGNNIGTGNSPGMVVNIDLEDVLFFNGISSPLALNINTFNKQLINAVVESEILQMNILPTASVGGESSIVLKDLAKFASAVSKNGNTGIASGSLSLVGKHSDGGIIWNGSMEKLRFNGEKFKLSPKEVKLKAILKDHILEYKDIKIQDANHTVFVTGKIFTQDLTTKTKIFYTPSAIEFLNEIPLLKDTLNIATLGATKNGLISFEVDVSGSLLAPEVQVNRASSTAKSIVKVGKIALVVKFLPLLLL